MAASLPYLASNKNVSLLFEKIAAAKVPEKFTHSFLTTTIGLKGTNDRALIPLLRNMGFIDQSGTPMPSYRLLKGHNQGEALADGMRRAYGPLFDADQSAQKLSSDRLKSLIAQVAGVDADATARIAATFSALSKLADFEAQANDGGTEDKADTDADFEEASPTNGQSKPKNLRTEFHYNLQIHLPTNGSEETYLNIFNAIRKTFQ
ncbi:DUF5343 domain-containing protein [Dongia soli]|uniref:DUF5343 domain-containing protein n=1 Tax=Dongia soli TaxID=600628 RepID=A0ABU5E8W9_9PROT|nr:DUF5343 domain-containing protein [Dongia soli]MDY0882367.1 DUF5343 domain-containing protein [Dongia soli]